MSVFAEKMKQARTVVKEVREAGIADADKIIAKGEMLHAKREAVAAAHHSFLDADLKELDAMERELDLLGNEARSDTGEQDPPKSWEQANR